MDVAENQRLSESPPLPSEETVYNYGTYDALNTYTGADDYSTATYDPTNPYTDISGATVYQYDSYNAEPGYSSGSDSYYSDFESHLKQYQSYKQNKDNTATSQGNDVLDDDDDEDNYYSVGYDAEQRQKRRQAQDQAKPSKRSQRINSSSVSCKSKLLLTTAFAGAFAKTTLIDASARQSSVRVKADRKRLMLFQILQGNRMLNLWSSDLAF